MGGDEEEAGCEEEQLEESKGREGGSAGGDLLLAAVSRGVKNVRIGHFRGYGMESECGFVCGNTPRLYRPSLFLLILGRHFW